MTDTNGHPVGVRYEPPHTPEAEAAILGGIILQNAALDRCGDLETGDFYDNRHKVVWSAMRNLAAAGRPIDVVLLEAEIEKVGKLEAIGGIAFLGELCLRVPTVDNIVAYKDVVKQDARNRRVMVELASAAERVRRGVYDPDELLAETIGELQCLLPVPAAPGEPATRWCAPLTEFLGDIEPSDDDAEDWIIRDVVPRGEAGLIAGPPKCGKTWAMLGLALDVALGRPWLDTLENTMGGPVRVLVLAFEDARRRLRKRVWELCRARGVTPNDATIRAHLSISQEPLTLPGDERAFAAELRGWRPQLVLIDNLTRVMPGDQIAIRDAKRFSDTWCKLCSDVGATVEFLHHTNKVGPLRPDKRGQGDPFELIRGSGDFMAAARHLVLIRPLESPDDVKLADVRMRGNLDLQREDFVMGFVRVQVAERWTAQLSYRGEGEIVRDELAEKRRAKQSERKAQGASDRGSSVDERVYAAIVEMAATGARELCTVEQLKHSSGVQHGAVRPALDRLVHAGRVQTESIRRREGVRWRNRAIFVPSLGGSA